MTRRQREVINQALKSYILEFLVLHMTEGPIGLPSVGYLVRHYVRLEREMAIERTLPEDPEDRPHPNYTTEQRRVLEEALMSDSDDDDSLDAWCGVTPPAPNSFD